MRQGTSRSVTGAPVPEPAPRRARGGSAPLHVLLSRPVARLRVAGSTRPGAHGRRPPRPAPPTPPRRRAVAGAARPPLPPARTPPARAVTTDRAAGRAGQRPDRARREIHGRLPLRSCYRPVAATPLTLGRTPDILDPRRS